MSIKKVLYYGTTILLLLYCIFYASSLFIVTNLATYTTLLCIGMSLFIFSIAIKIVIIVFSKNKENSKKMPYIIDGLTNLLLAFIFFLLVCMTSVPTIHK